MELFNAIKERRSVRAFKSTPIPNELIDKIIEAGRWAPSAGNCQAREFIIIENVEVKKRLCEAALNQHFIEDAPVNIVVCANEQMSSGRYGLRGTEFYCLLDAAASVQNMLLAIHALGLGACWVGAFNDTLIIDALGLTEYHKPVAIIPFGYPDETPRKPPRRPFNDVVHVNRYIKKLI